MIVSMTGFGSASSDHNGVSCVVELRSVNNRFFKAGIKLPDELAGLEQDIDVLLRENIGRGSISLTVSMKSLRAESGVTINQAALSGYIEQLKALQGTLRTGVNQPAITVDLANLLMLPGVCDSAESPAAPDDARAFVFGLCREAIKSHAAMRRKEGEMLWKDLSANVEAIRQSLQQVVAQAPNVSKLYHEKLRARVLQMVSDAKLSLSDHDLLKEVVLFADRSDISEEITRLGGHLDQFLDVCQRENQAGRKLDFIAQEMLRETNTIASKANDSIIARLTVDMKSSIDRIKEQVQNVE